MSSVVSICNLALVGIGAASINDLEEPTTEARACKRFYEHVRDTLLQSHPWRFAGKTLSLAQIANDRPGSWSYAYTRPNDCLKIRWVRPGYSALDPYGRYDDRPECVSHPFDSDGGVIYCNLSPAVLRYTGRVADPTQLPPLFVDALAAHLSARLAMPITKDLKIRSEAYRIATIVTAQAETADANEVRETTDHASEFVTGRG